MRRAESAQKTISFNKNEKLTTRIGVAFKMDTLKSFCARFYELETVMKMKF